MMTAAHDKGYETTWSNGRESGSSGDTDEAKTGDHSTEESKADFGIGIKDNEATRLRPRRPNITGPQPKRGIKRADKPSAPHNSNTSSSDTDSEDTRLRAENYKTHSQHARRKIRNKTAGKSNGGNIDGNKTEVCSFHQ